MPLSQQALLYDTAVPSPGLFCRPDIIGNACSGIEFKCGVYMSVSVTAYELSDGKNHICPPYFHGMSVGCT